MPSTAPISGAAKRRCVRASLTLNLDFWSWTGISAVRCTFFQGDQHRSGRGLIMSSWLSQCFGLIGMLVAARMLFSIGRALWVYFLRPGKNLRKLGSWAVVTGATDGIGRALCDALARKGVHCHDSHCYFSSANGRCQIKT